MKLHGMRFPFVSISLAELDASGPRLQAVLALNPQALDEARALERTGGVEPVTRSPMSGPFTG